MGLKENFDFQEFISKGTPSHKPCPDIQFLQWFIGFFEAEGCLQCWQTKSKKGTVLLRFALEITQKDPGLMYKIRTRLGFGKTGVYQKPNGNIYWRFFITKKKGLEALIFLFNGNLRTEKKRKQFQKWLFLFNQRYATDYTWKSQTCALTLDEAWLSGFLEGDAGFYVSPPKLLSLNNNDKLVAKFSLRFYLTQKDEQTLLREIAALFQIKTALKTLTNGHSALFYNRLESSNFQSLSLILNYLKKYGFLGQRAIQLSRWQRLFAYKQEKKLAGLTPKAFCKLQRLIQGTKAPLSQSKFGSSQIKDKLFKVKVQN